MGKWIGREAAQWPHLVGAILILLVPLLNLTTDQTGAVIAVIVAVTGGATTLTVSGEKAAPLAAGLLKSTMAVALAANLEFSPSAQAAVMVFVEAIVAWYLRTQVVAPVPPLPVQTLPVTQHPTPPVPVMITPAHDPLPVAVTPVTPSPLPVEVVATTNIPAAYVSAAATGGRDDVQIVHDPQTESSFLDTDVDPLRGPHHQGPPLS